MTLYQVDDDGKLHLVAFDGHKLYEAELRYPMHEKEFIGNQGCTSEMASLYWKWIANYDDHESWFIEIHEHNSETIKATGEMAWWISTVQSYHQISP